MQVVKHSQVDVDGLSSICTCTIMVGRTKIKTSSSFMIMFFTLKIHLETLYTLFCTTLPLLGRLPVDGGHLDLKFSKTSLKQL